MLNISVIILAGGKSSRMGENKALIKVNNQTLLTRTYNVAKQVSDLIYVVSPWHEKYRLILPQECQFIPEEKNTFAGPLIAFFQSILYVKTEWVLLLACDLPLLDIKEIQKWLNYLPNLDHKTMAFLPKNNKGWEVLCGFYHQKCFSSLKTFVERGGKSFQTWLENEQVESIPCQRKDIFFNCNTPQELEKIRHGQ